MKKKQVKKVAPKGTILYARGGQYEVSLSYDQPTNTVRRVVEITNGKEKVVEEEVLHDYEVDPIVDFTIADFKDLIGRTIKNGEIVKLKIVEVK